MMDLTVRYICRPDIVWRKIGDEVLLLPIHSRLDDMESMFTLNEMAAKVWSMLDGRRNLLEVRDAILDEYEAEPQQVEQDIANIVEQWLEINAIEAV